MTYEEALKHFKSLQKRYITEHNGNMCEKVALAIEALEKQIPKKPSELYGWICCPNCESSNISEWLDGGYNETKHKCCPDCGQAIDWGADEET